MRRREPTGRSNEDKKHAKASPFMGLSERKKEVTGTGCTHRGNRRCSLPGGPRVFDHEAAPYWRVTHVGKRGVVETCLVDRDNSFLRLSGLHELGEKLLDVLISCDLAWPGTGFLPRKTGSANTGAHQRLRNRYLKYVTYDVLQDRSSHERIFLQALLDESHECA
jgi:hypothetical protein